MGDKIMLNIDYLFEICLITSIKGSILIILIFGLQRLFRKDFTAKWVYILWSLVIIRLLIPVSPIVNVLSIYNLGIIKRLKFSINGVLLGRLGSVSEDFNIIGNTVLTGKFIEHAFSFNWIDFFSIVWITGVIALLLVFIYIIVKIHILFRNSYKYNDKTIVSIMENCLKKINLRKKPDLYISSELSSPMTYGVISPKIVIPEAALLNLDSQKLEHIFLHELIHIKRYDVLFNTLGMLVCVIHWFNPLVWICFIRSKKDCELACDEGVLKYLTRKEYTQYGLTLIQMIEFVSQHGSQNLILSKTLIHDRSEANARILQISKFKRKKKSIIILSTLIVAFITFIGLNESGSTRPTISRGKADLYNYLQVTEHKVRSIFGIKPIHSYFLKVDESPYFILSYNVLGEKVQFWYDGTIGEDSRKTLEITTTSYKGIVQGMSIEDFIGIAQTQFTKLIEVQRQGFFTNYIYEDINCHVMVLVDNKSNKVYSLTLY